MMANEKLGLILSIRGEHAARILDGSKQFELRKSLPKVDFRRVYLYESGGKGIIGCFDPAQVIRLEKTALWDRVNYKATTRYRFDKYFDGRPLGCAIEVKNPVPFGTPLALNELRRIQHEFHVPMSAAAINLQSPLGAVLERRRKSSLRKMGPRVELNPIGKEDRKTYEKWVLEHVGGRYEGIDASFASRNLNVHDIGHDPAGFFTERKDVLSVVSNGKRVGFTTITWKNNGCAKTGPTILGEKHRGKGLGAATRRALENLARNRGYRKIYCTCADNALQVIKYLLQSGMKIEAHLDRQYSGDHGELVFGKFLIAEEYTERPLPNRKLLAGKLIDPRAIESDRLRDALVNLFSRDWIPIESSFAGRVIKSALTPGRPDPRRKSKRLVCVGTRSKIHAMVLLLPKRGGAVKALLTTATYDKESLGLLIDEVVQLSRSWDSRKIYFLHPLLDAPIVTALKRSQFQMEGFLKAPYRPGEDVGVFSRFC